jgi:hypothetical protein
MNTTEAIVIVGGVALGYWIVAVMWPNLRKHDTRPPAPVPPAAGTRWHDVLGTAPDASLDEIVAAYTAKRSAYEADQAAQQSAEMQEQIRFRLEQLDLAYDAARRDVEWLRDRNG